MSDAATAGPLTSRLSGAVLKIWASGEKATIPTEVVEFLHSRPGLRPLGDTLFAVTTVAGDAAVYDAALTWSQRLRSGDLGTKLGCLIAPGLLRLTSEDTAELEPDPVSRDLEGADPDLEPDVYLTSRAFQNLEYPAEHRGGQVLHTATGITVPLIRTGAVRFDQPPWRNRDVLGQTSPWIERVDVSMLESSLEEPVLRLVGPTGSGKTRLAAESLRRLGLHHVWLTTRPERLAGPTLAEQLLRQFLLPSAAQSGDPLHPKLAGETDRGLIRQALERRQQGDREHRILNERALAALGHLAAASTPATIVIDDFHAARGHDLEFAEGLAEAPQRWPVRLIFVSRDGALWGDRLAATPRIEIGPLGDGELRRLSAQLTSGFSLPEAIVARFIDSTAGSPFALEEGLFALVHDKSLRRVYGSFFFAGNEERGFVPSLRFIRHVDAEVQRLTDPWPARLLSLLETSAPPAELAAALPAGGPTAQVDWHLPLARAGMLASASSPWGEGVLISSEAERRALAALLPEQELSRLRQLIGVQLAGAARTGEAHWLSYRLLQGSEQAITPLLALFAAGDTKQIPAAELLAALAGELEGLRQRQADPQIELELLWRMLPLARKMGTLRNYSAELERGVELARSDPQRLLALASIKAEMDQEGGRHQEAEATIKRALEAAADVDPKRKALLLIQLGRLLIRRQRLAEARQLFTNVRQAVSTSGANPLAATCDFYLGNIALAEGELEEAHRHHVSSLEERQKQGSNKATGSSLSALGAVAIASGNYPQALDYYRQAEQALEAHGKSGETSYSLLGQARALNRLGDFTGAIRPVRRALELREGGDDTVGEALARIAVARNYLDIGQPDVALEEARKAHFQFDLISAREHLADADSLLGRIHLSQRRYDAAERRFEAARKLHLKEGETRAAAFDLAGLLDISLAREDAQAVRRHTTDLKNLLPELPSSDLSDILAYRLYLGLEFLTQAGLKVGNPVSYLERAYRGVLEKAEHLSHEQRQRYLFQIPDNQAILAAATERGLAAAR